MKPHDKSCPECGGLSFYHTATPANGGYGPTLLPGLGTFFVTAKFEVVVCADCGLTRFYAEPKARTELRGSRRWQPL